MVDIASYMSDVTHLQAIGSVVLLVDFLVATTILQQRIVRQTNMGSLSGKRRKSWPMSAKSHKSATPRTSEREIGWKRSSSTYRK